MKDPNNPQEGEAVEMELTGHTIPHHAANHFLSKGYAITPKNENQKHLALFTVNPGTPEERFYITINGIVSKIDTPEEESLKNDISLNILLNLAKIKGRNYPK